MDERQTPSLSFVSNWLCWRLSWLCAWFTIDGSCLQPTQPHSTHSASLLTTSLSRHAWMVSSHSHSLVRVCVVSGRWVLLVVAGVIIRRMTYWAASCTSTSGPPNQTGTQHIASSLSHTQVSSFTCDRLWCGRWVCARGAFCGCWHDHL